MKESFVVTAEPRADQGKGASRRLRREGKVPAVVYGGQDKAESLALSHNEMWKHLQTEAFFSHILTLKSSGKSQQVVLKDLQRHPVSNYIIHVDLQRVLADQVLRIHVPLHFKGGDVAPGVKTGGGIIEHHLNQVTVECLPKDLPEFIEVDISALELNESMHLSQVKLPEGVKLVDLKHGKDLSVVSVHMPRAIVEEEVAPAEAAATAEVPATAQKVEAAAPAAEAGKKEEKKK